MKYDGHEQPEWNREHLMNRDGCQDTIRSYWSMSNLNPSQDFYPDPEGAVKCTVCCKTFKRQQDLKAHRTRQRHHESRNKIMTKTAVADVADTQEERRNAKCKSFCLLPKVMWGKRKVQNSWLLKYLGSAFEAGGGEIADVKIRIAMATQRFGKLRHIWTDNTLHKKLRMRLYKSCVMTYGSEAWKLTGKVIAALNGANARMVSIITGRTAHQEASAKWRTFNLVTWIRARRLQWLGHIL